MLMVNLLFRIAVTLPHGLAPSQPSPGALNRPTTVETCSTCTAAVLRTAWSQLGARYVHGGADPSGGFDCAGLVLYVYRTSCGSALPHGSKAQFEIGQRVARNDLRPGDLVFFRFPKIGWHVGIYIGNNEFIHSPNRRRVVAVNSLLARAYTVTYMGARRVLSDAVASVRRCRPAAENVTAADLGAAMP
jgi:cell wall-associated NlpC family hydrolase